MQASTSHAHPRTTHAGPPDASWLSHTGTVRKHPEVDKAWCINFPDDKGEWDEGCTAVYVDPWDNVSKICDWLKDSRHKPDLHAVKLASVHDDGGTPQDNTVHEAEPSLPRLLVISGLVKVRICCINNARASGELAGSLMFVCGLGLIAWDDLSNSFRTWIGWMR